MCKNSGLIFSLTAFDILPGALGTRFPLCHRFITHAGVSLLGGRRTVPCVLESPVLVTVSSFRHRKGIWKIIRAKLLYYNNVLLAFLAYKPICLYIDFFSALITSMQQKHPSLSFDIFKFFGILGFSTTLYFIQRCVALHIASLGRSK